MSCAKYCVLWVVQCIGVCGWVVRCGYMYDVVACMRVELGELRAVDGARTQRRRLLHALPSPILTIPSPPPCLHLC